MIFQKRKLILLLIFCVFTCTNGKQKESSKVHFDSLKVYKMISESLSKGDTLSALNILERLLEINLNEQLVNKYREIYVTQDNCDRPIRFFKELVSKYERNADYHYGLGMAYIDKIQKSSGIGMEVGMLVGLAIEEFNKAIEIDSLHWSANYALGTTYLNMPKEFNLTNEAIKIFERLISIQEKSDTLLPHYSLSYLSLGDAYTKFGKHAKAITIWKKGISLFPDEIKFKERLTQK